ncbi:MAG TPA: UDP-3-O-acyl-N-acetylglucosamine deacetylase [bacterium]|nr:UDP-3-O-acyl-N-acetylglucosamine deacetylase [bacterium]
MASQQTIASARTLRGTGLHTGRDVAMVLRAAEPGTGIVFRRTDRPGAEIPARLDRVTGTASCVALGGDGGVRTVEHLLSAARALGVDNLLVDVDGPEVPGMDGSALPFVLALREAGLRAQDTPRRVVRVGVPAWAGDGEGGWAVALPAERLSITCVVALREPAAQEQAATFDAAADGYEETIAPARTWGYERDAAALRARGLALGASLENTLAIGGRGFLNAPRFPNEPARHKVLDVLGDLALLGAELRAAVIAVRAGHTLHVALARALAAQTQSASS